MLKRELPVRGAIVFNKTGNFRKEQRRDFICDKPGKSDVHQSYLFYFFPSPFFFCFLSRSIFLYTKRKLLFLTTTKAFCKKKKKKKKVESMLL
jgi:hypothetical protein